MLIHKILNNNVVLILDQNNEEQIVMGRGIAFKKRVGDNIDESIIDKIFMLKDQKVKNNFTELIKDIPMDYIEVAYEIMQYAKANVGENIDENLIISLSDHIHTAVERYIEGIEIKNVLLWDIKKFYKTEFEIGLKALDIIDQKLNVKLPEDEAGFIAMHVVNRIMNENIGNMYDITKIIQEILNIVKYYLGIKFDEDSVYFYRFVTHIKYFAQRLISGKTYENENEDSLFEIIKGRYQEPYKCVEKISEFIQKKYKYNLSDEEKLYLTIHIARIHNK